jgi:hypothetical protein
MCGIRFETNDLLLPQYEATKIAYAVYIVFPEKYA